MDVGEMPSIRLSATAEWKANWKLPLAAMLGYSAGGLQSFAIGPFVAPLQRSFAWTMTQVLMGLSLSAFLTIFLSTLVGMLIDRLGPRKVGMTGLCVNCTAFALLATATGTLANWLFLWVFVALGAALLQSNVWTSAVISRFDRARGSAMAVALSGGALTAAIAPPIATLLIEARGWREGFLSVALCWLVVCLPTTFLFFRGTRDRDRSSRSAAREDAEEPTGMPFHDGIRTRAFVCLSISFATFAFYSSFMAANLVPLLKQRGLGPMSAAGVASIMGAAGILSRLVVGYLLDRIPGNRIGFVTQMLPVVGCAMLLIPGAGVPLFAIAVGSFGIATGAEMDVTLYLASRHFGLRSFGSLLGAVMTFGAVSATLGPLSTGLVFDRTGGYDPILYVVMIFMTVGAVAVLRIGRPGRHA